MDFVGFPGQAGRYVSGLCVGTLGLCAAGAELLMVGCGEEEAW